AASWRQRTTEWSCKLRSKRCVNLKNHARYSFIRIQNTFVKELRGGFMFGRREAGKRRSRTKIFGRSWRASLERTKSDGMGCVAIAAMKAMNDVILFPWRRRSRLKPIIRINSARRHCGNFWKTALPHWGKLSFWK